MQRLNNHSTEIIARMIAALPPEGKATIIATIEMLILSQISANISDSEEYGKLYRLVLQPLPGKSTVIQREIMWLLIKEKPKAKTLYKRLYVYPAKRFNANGEVSNESLEIREDVVTCVNSTILRDHCEIVDRWLSIYPVDIPVRTS